MIWLYPAGDIHPVILTTLATVAGLTIPGKARYVAALIAGAAKDIAEYTDLRTFNDILDGPYILLCGLAAVWQTVATRTQLECAPFPPHLFAHPRGG